MASSSSLNTQEAIDLNDAPSVMQVPTAIPEVWHPYFLSLNGPVSVTDSVMLNGVTATAVACVASVSNMGHRLHVRNLMKLEHYSSQVTILQRLLKEKQSKTTVKLQKQYEKLLAEVKELASLSIPK
uniref:Uncharacterized protein n=1 Tax=Fagus sylvatica TaxID=28930 RepID=A0A2N9IIB7_FAGSY